MTLTIVLAICLILLLTLLIIILRNPKLFLFRGKKKPDKKKTVERTEIDPMRTIELTNKVPAKVKAADKELYYRCCRYMELRKPFLVEGFSLEDMSLALLTNKLYLSQTINNCSGRNFRTYVNCYRVMYAMELYKKNNRLRVCDLSNLSGFHTPVTFNMAFKLFMDESPSTWCARVRKGKSKY